MDRELKANEYEGNGWTRYQKLVLEQLDAHKLILQSIIADIQDLKTHVAVSEALNNSWKNSIDISIKEQKDHLRFIMEDDKGINSRLKKIEEDHLIEARSSLKLKGLWALIGSGIIIAIDVGFKILGQFFKFAP